MSAKEYSILIEKTLRQVNGPSYRKSDEILFNPYEEIFLALEYKVPQEKVDRFKLSYQSISGRTLQELIDNDYDMEQLIKDLRQIVENN